MEIKNWKSVDTFDDKLKTIDHYEIHPEMLPYVGKHYEKARILLVGESHYLSNDVTYCDKEYVGNRWYEEEVPTEFNDKENFDTRRVVTNFLIRRRTRAHSMFRNPAKGIIEALGLKNVTDSEAFTACAFMNYFQRPALLKGESIENIDEDNKRSYEVFKGCKKNLDPKVTIFLSKKAFDAYQKSHKEQAKDVYCVMHPTCPHWNGNNGKDKFIRIIKNYLTEKSSSIHFEPNPKISLKDIVFPDEYTLVKTKQFDSQKIYVRFWGFYDNITEIAIFFIHNDVKYGIGFVVWYGYTWKWNYSENNYVTEDELKDDEELKNFFDEFEKWIRNIKEEN